MQALCGLQGIFDLFNCKTPGQMSPTAFTVIMAHSSFFNWVHYNMISYAWIHVSSPSSGI